MHIFRYLIKTYLLILLLNHQVSYSSNEDCVKLVKNSPSEYQVHLNCNKSNYEVELKQRFNKDWRLYLTSEFYNEKKFNFIQKIDANNLDLTKTNISNNLLFEISDVKHEKTQEGFNRWELENWANYYLNENNKILILYYPELIYRLINNFLFYFFYPATLLFLTIKGISWQKKRK